MPQPSAYCPSQLIRYLTHISLPISTFPPSLTLDYLTALHVHQICTVPYENLSLHYSQLKNIDLNPQVLYKKLIGDADGERESGVSSHGVQEEEAMKMRSRGRGGYCMENSIFFNHVLRALGFDVYTTGVRIRLREGGVPGGDFIGWSHIVNIVTLPNGVKYMLDVAFGGDGATHPVPLISNHQTPNLGTQEIRLLHDFIPSQTQRSDPSRRLWIYQYRNGPYLAWNSFYAFPEFEFVETDFKVMNWYTSTHEDSFQNKVPVVVKFLMGEDDDDGKRGKRVVGKVMLAGRELKRNLGGRTEILKICETENERVEALREWFGIVLTGEEKVGIKGAVAELPS